MMIVYSQRFFPKRLQELINPNSVVVKHFVKHKDEEAVAEAIIEKIRYPFYMGEPDDTHIYNCYHGDYRWCKRIDSDYWQSADETLTILVGDCEDSSIAFCAAMRVFLTELQVYEVFGVIRDYNTKRILGGHGRND